MKPTSILAATIAIAGLAVATPNSGRPELQPTALKSPPSRNQTANWPASGSPVSRYVRGDTLEASELLRAQLRAAAEQGSEPGRAPTIGISRAYGPCTLFPGVIYLRKEYRYKHVGVKPLTKCSDAVVAPTLIEHQTELRFHWYNWWIQAGTTFVGRGRNEHRYLTRDIHYECLGPESAIWSGTTQGKVVWQGHTYYARVYQSAKELNCSAEWP